MDLFDGLSLLEDVYSVFESSIEESEKDTRWNDQGLKAKRNLSAESLDKSVSDQLIVFHEIQDNPNFDFNNVEKLQPLKFIDIDQDDLNNVIKIFCFLIGIDGLFHEKEKKLLNLFLKLHGFCGMSDNLEKSLNGFSMSEEKITLEIKKMLNKLNSLSHVNRDLLVKWLVLFIKIDGDYSNDERVVLREILGTWIGWYKGFLDSYVK